ncbi:MAG: hypothetical protein HN390_01485 [Anaerolineae bacterium]|jgi:hypothetical protein|nr:hypothetical protein [Anaerolineae bacterium]MBT7192127.1 hypothetical protein [Anaerolineae bacterium]
MTKNVEYEKMRKFISALLKENQETFSVDGWVFVNLAAEHGIIVPDENRKDDLVFMPATFLKHKKRWNSFWAIGYLTCECERFKPNFDDETVCDKCGKPRPKGKRRFGITR